MNPWQKNFWSGILANGPMTLTLMQFQKKSVALSSNSLPPARLTDEVVPDLMQRHLSSNGRANLTLLSHFAYSIAGAGAYSVFVKRNGGSPLIKGGLFGVGVWGLSYLGWIPAFGFQTNAFQMSKKRNLQMLAAHLAWGVSLALSNQELSRQGNKMFDAKTTARRDLATKHDKQRARQASQSSSEPAALRMRGL